MRLFLCGGGSGEQTLEANKRLNEIIDHTKPLLYVPLAMDESIHPYEGCYEWITGELSSVDFPNIEMVNSFDELANKNYNDYCAIFIGGGNTFKLLKGLKETGALKKLKIILNMMELYLDDLLELLYLDMILIVVLLWIKMMLV